MTTGQSNIGMRLHGYWVIYIAQISNQPETYAHEPHGVSVTRRLQNLARAEIFPDSNVTTLIRLLTSQDSITIPENLQGNHARQYRGDLGSERAGNDDELGGRDRTGPTKIIGPRVTFSLGRVYITGLAGHM
jgi:hypothetical protein